MVEGVIPALRPITLLESQGNKLFFRAVVLKWDKSNPDWSLKSSNGVRYNRQATIEAFKKGIEQNGGLPVLYNHIIEGEGAQVLGRITNVIDTSEGLIVEGYLDRNDNIVKEKIEPGYLTNVSLQVIAEDYWRESDEEEGEVIYAKPSRALEVSFVPVNGVEGAKLLDLAIAESIKSKEKLDEFIIGLPSDMKSELKRIADKPIYRDYNITGAGKYSISNNFILVLGWKDRKSNDLNPDVVDNFVRDITDFARKFNLTIIRQGRVKNVGNDTYEILLRPNMKEDITTSNASAVYTIKQGDMMPNDNVKVIATFDNEDDAKKYIIDKNMEGKWEVEQSHDGKFIVVDIVESMIEFLHREYGQVFKEFYKVITFSTESEFKKAKKLLDDNGLDYISEDDSGFSIEFLNPEDYQKALKILSGEVDFYEGINLKEYGYNSIRVFDIEDLETLKKDLVQRLRMIQTLDRGDNTVYKLVYKFSNYYGEISVVINENKKIVSLEISKMSQLDDYSDIFRYAEFIKNFVDKLAEVQDFLSRYR